MTREEAIKIIKATKMCLEKETNGIDDDCNFHNCDDCNLCYEQGNSIEKQKAYEMAIKALEEPRWIPVTEDTPPKGTICLWCNKQGSVFTSEITHRSEYSSYVGKHGYFSNGLDNYGDIVAWMPLPQPYRAESEEDMIEKGKWGKLGFEKIDIQSEKTMGDRLDDLPYELNPIEQLKELKTILLGKHHIADCEALDMAIKALEQKPCEDCISREDAMSMILCYGNEIKAEVMDDIKASMIKLPPVTPQYTDAEIQKMQELEQAEIEKAYELGKEDKMLVCSACGLDVHSDYKTCPRCGTKMESEVEE